MEDKESQQDPNQHVTERSEPVRSRWTPKPEQILILESIFNSGMVNPPKDETVRIRKLLEKFGSVGDANVFYWFQNRRSRSRRRQRQLQASLAASGGGDQRTNTNVITYISPQALNSNSGGGSGAIHQYIESGSNNITTSNYMCMGLTNSPSCLVASSPSSYLLGSSSSSSGGVGDNCMESLFPQMGFQDLDQQSSGVTHPIYCPSSDTSNLHYQAGLITVFINGVATEVSRGALDIRAMFGQDVILVHSSGFPIPTNEFGFLMQSLQHGESYFLVPRPT